MADSLQIPCRIQPKFLGIDEVKHGGTLGTLGQTFRHCKGAVTGSVICGWDRCDTWDRGPQSVIRFTPEHVVARDTLTMDRLVSVYQGDANAVSDWSETKVLLELLSFSPQDSRLDSGISR
jgi:hypothetical protein